MDEAIKKYAYWEDKDWWPISTWPTYIVNMAISQHLNNRDGYRFFLFLIGNGLDPEAASRILTLLYSYDNYQAQYLLRKYRTKQLTGTYFDLVEKKVLPFTAKSLFNS